MGSIYDGLAVACFVAALCGAACCLGVYLGMREAERVAAAQKEDTDVR